MIAVKVFWLLAWLQCLSACGVNEYQTAWGSCDSCSMVNGCTACDPNTGLCINCPDGFEPATPMMGCKSRPCNYDANNKTFCDLLAPAACSWCWTDEAKTAGRCLSPTVSSSTQNDYVTCVYLEGDLIVPDGPIPAFTNIKAVSRDLYLSEADPATWAALGTLEHVGGLLRIAQWSGQLRSLDCFGNVRSVGSLLVTARNLETFGEGFSQLRNASSVELRNMPKLTNITGLGLEVVGELRLAVLPLLAAVPALRLHTVGWLVVDDCALLQNLTAFSNLRSLQSLTLLSLPSLTSLSGLEQVHTLSGRLLLGYLPALTDISGLGLHTAPDSYRLTSLRLTTLAALSDLSALGGLGAVSEVSLDTLPGVTSLSFLRHTTFVEAEVVVSGLGVTSMADIRAFADPQSDQARNSNYTTIGFVFLHDLSALVLQVREVALLDIEYCNGLASLRLPALHDVGTLRLKELPALVTLEAPALARVNTKLEFQSNAAIGNLTLESLLYCEYCDIENNVNLVDVSLPVLRTVSMVQLLNNKMAYADLPQLSTAGLLALGGADLRGLGFGSLDMQGTSMALVMAPSMCCVELFLFFTRIHAAQAEVYMNFYYLQCTATCPYCPLSVAHNITGATLPAGYNNSYGAPPQAVACAEGYHPEGPARLCGEQGFWQGEPQNCSACAPLAATCTSPDETLTCIGGAPVQNGLCCDSGPVSCASTGQLPCVTPGGPCLPDPAASTATSTATATAASTGPEPAGESTSTAETSTQDGTDAAAASDSTAAQAGSSTGPHSSSSTGSSVAIPTVTSQALAAIPVPSGAVRVSATVPPGSSVNEFAASLLAALGVPEDRLRVLGVGVAPDGSMELYFDVLPGNGEPAESAFARLEASGTFTGHVRRWTAPAKSSALSLAAVGLIIAGAVVAAALLALLIANCVRRRKRAAAGTSPQKYRKNVEQSSHDDVEEEQVDVIVRVNNFTADNAQSTTTTR